MGNCYCKNKELIELQKITFEEVKEQQYNFTKAKIIKVYDGDTFWIATWYNKEIIRFNVRLYGVDTPEMKGGDNESKEQARVAKEYVENFILNKIVDIEVMNNKKYNNKIIKEKYGRLLAIIKINGIDLADDLIKKGYGKPYFGKKKE